MSNTTEEDSYHFGLKVVIVGDSGVGKSSIVDSNSSPSRKARSKAEPTVGVNLSVKDYNVEGRSYRVQLWDCPGAERYMKLTARYAAGTTGFIFVFDGKSHHNTTHITELGQN